MANFDDLPPFDVKSHCIKCGYVIPDPVAPAPKTSAEGKVVSQEPAPLPEPPATAYCNGEACPLAEPGVAVPEHMHQFCICCNFEWLSQPLG